MNRFKRYLPISAMKLMYDSLILSHLQFGITNWGFEWDRISKLQKRALRILTNSKYNAHTEPLFKQLRLLKVNDIFDVQCLKVWYKFVNKKLPNYFRDIFKVSSFKFLFENRFWATGPYKRRNSNCTYITTTQISVMGNITTHGGLYNFFECQVNELCQITYGFLMVITEDLDTFKHWYITEIISWNQFLS